MASSSPRPPIRFAALAIAVLALLAPTAAQARPLFGFQGVSADSSHATSADLSTVRKLGGRAIRVQAYWAALQPTSADAYNPEALAALDRVVNGAARKHVKVILFADGTPCWAADAPSDVQAKCAAGDLAAAQAWEPRDTAAFATLSAFLVKRYSTKLAAYQIWNEPDQANEYYWKGPDKVARYVALMKAAYPAVKQVSRKVPVIAGSFVGVNGAWLTAMYQAGAKGSYDGLAVHFYDLPLYGLRNTHAVQRRFHDRKPLWLTEFGFDSCYRRGGPANLVTHPCVSRTNQARAAADVFRAVARTSWVKAAIMYELRDQDDQFAFGVIDLRGRAKPVFRTLRRLLPRRNLGAMSRPTLHLGHSGGRAVAYGRASLVDLYTLKVTNGSLTATITLRTDRFGAFRVKLPAQLGTHGLRGTLRANWSGRSAAHARS